MLEPDEELRRFLGSTVAIVVGSVDRQLVPQICRGWGLRFEGDGVLSLCLDRVPAMRTIANLRENPRVAITFTSPQTYRSIQLKGRCIEVMEPDEADRERATEHRHAFAEVCEPIGLSWDACSNMWTSETIKIRFQPEQAFDQTPGPARGRQL